MCSNSCRYMIVLLIIYTCVISNCINAKSTQDMKQRGKKGKQKSSSKKKYSGPVCQDVAQYQFDPKPPHTAKDLTLCQQYSRSTCCNATHTMQILRKVYPLYDEHVSSTCREFSVEMMCAPCDAHYGIGIRRGVCLEMCDLWYLHCAQEMYTLDSLGQFLVPCTSDSLVCSRLNTIVNNGARFCEMTGFSVVSPPSHDVNKELAALVDSSTSTSRPPCFDGRVTVVQPPSSSSWFPKVPKAKNVSKREWSRYATKEKIRWYIVKYWPHVLFTPIVLLTVRWWLKGLTAPSAAQVRAARLQKFSSRMGASTS